MCYHLGEIFMNTRARTSGLIFGILALPFLLTSCGLGGPAEGTIAYYNKNDINNDTKDHVVTATISDVGKKIDTPLGALIPFELKDGEEVLRIFHTATTSGQSPNLGAKAKVTFLQKELQKPGPGGVTGKLRLALSIEQLK
jgi:hypothetical protein